MFIVIAVIFAGAFYFFYYKKINSDINVEQVNVTHQKNRDNNQEASTDKSAIQQEVNKILGDGEGRKTASSTQTQPVSKVQEDVNKILGQREEIKAASSTQSKSGAEIQEEINKILK